jgi:16S rRNA G527 N7-methylase RsmG
LPFVGYTQLSEGEEGRRVSVLGQRQQQQVNQAAEKFTDALIESYQTMTERAIAAQERNVELTQQFFNAVLNNLRAQADGNLETTQQLADQQQRQREATQALTQESVSAYMDFINSMFSFWQGGIEAAERRSR